MNIQILTHDKTIWMVGWTIIYMTLGAIFAFSNGLLFKDSLGTIFLVVFIFGVLVGGIIGLINGLISLCFAQENRLLLAIMILAGASFRITLYLVGIFLFINKTSGIALILILIAIEPGAGTIAGTVFSSIIGLLLDNLVQRRIPGNKLINGLMLGAIGGMIGAGMSWLFTGGMFWLLLLYVVVND